MHEWIQLAIALQTIQSISARVGLKNLGLETKNAEALGRSVTAAQVDLARLISEREVDLAFELGLDV